MIDWAVEPWIPKAEAAELLGISTKSVEQWAQRGALESRKEKGPNGPKIVAYHPQDVARLIAETIRNAKPLKTTHGQIVDPRPQPVNIGPSIPTNELAVSARSKQAPVPFDRNFEALKSLLLNNPAQSQTVLAPSELRHRLYLSEDEAVRFTGLGKTELRRTLKPSKRGPRAANVYKRAELERL